MKWEKPRMADGISPASCPWDVMWYNYACPPQVIAKIYE